VKLRLEDITGEAKETSFAEPEAEINRLLSEGPVREFRLAGPVAVTISYYRAGTQLFFSGQLAARTAAACARCAEEFDDARGRPFRFVLAPRVIGYESEHSLRDEDLEFSLYDGEQIDLSPLIREQVLLALPTRALCQEDCRGLCPRCGANLNRGDCGCRIEPVETADSRFAALHSLKLPRS
jgi:uncharacterized protein